MGVQKEYEIEGRMWTSKMLAEYAEIKIQAAKVRLSKYSRGEMSVKSLFSKGNNNKKYKEYIVNGEVWTVPRLAEKCGLSETTARQRLVRYCNGEHTVDQLFHVGSLPCGGQKISGNAEYRALSDSEKTCKPLRGGPGLWERKHIKPREICNEL